MIVCLWLCVCDRVFDCACDCVLVVVFVCLWSCLVACVCVLWVCFVGCVLCIVCFWLCCVLCVLRSCSAHCDLALAVEVRGRGGEEEGYLFSATRRSQSPGKTPRPEVGRGTLKRLSVKIEQPSPDRWGKTSEKTTPKLGRPNREPLGRPTAELRSPASSGSLFDSEAHQSPREGGEDSSRASKSKLLLWSRGE